jgi:hypothetical protein
VAEARSIVYLVVGILWILLETGIAAAAFYRFRATPAGFVLGGAFALMAVKGVATQILTRTVLRGPAFNEGAYAAVQLGIGSLSFLLLVAAAVGIALIPLSLRRLSASS